MEYDDQAYDDQVHDEGDVSGGSSNPTMPTLMEHTDEEDNELNVGTEEVWYDDGK
jgi:hypothetical protein